MRSRAAALILSCGIVFSIRRPVPAPGHRRVITMGEENPRKGCAALVLCHYFQRRAGVARIRQAWLPEKAYAPAPRVPTRYGGWRCAPCDLSVAPNRPLGVLGPR